MNKPINISGHITQTLLHEFADGTLGQDALIAAAAHIAECEQCALALAEAIEAKQAANVPAGFDEEVFCRIAHLTEKKTGGLVHFSFRVALAACVSLLFIFSGTLNRLADPNHSFEKIKSPDFSVVETINTNLQNFSHKILTMEVFQHDKETK